MGKLFKKSRKRTCRKRLYSGKRQIKKRIRCKRLYGGKSRKRQIKKRFSKSRKSKKLIGGAEQDEAKSKLQLFVELNELQQNIEQLRRELLNARSLNRLNNEIGKAMEEMRIKVEEIKKKNYDPFNFKGTFNDKKVVCTFTGRNPEKAILRIIDDDIHIDIVPCCIESYNDNNITFIKYNHWGPNKIYLIKDVEFQQYAS